MDESSHPSGDRNSAQRLRSDCPVERPLDDLPQLPVWDDRKAEPILGAKANDDLKAVAKQEAQKLWHKIFKREDSPDTRHRVSWSDQQRVLEQRQPLRKDILNELRSVARRVAGHARNAYLGQQQEPWLLLHYGRFEQWTERLVQATLWDGLTNSWGTPAKLYYGGGGFGQADDDLPSIAAYISRQATRLVFMSVRVKFIPDEKADRRAARQAFLGSLGISLYKLKKQLEQHRPQGGKPKRVLRKLGLEDIHENTIENWWYGITEPDAATRRKIAAVILLCMGKDPKDDEGVNVILAQLP